MQPLAPTHDCGNERESMCLLTHYPFFYWESSKPNQRNNWLELLCFLLFICDGLASYMAKSHTIYHKPTKRENFRALMEWTMICQPNEVVLVGPLLLFLKIILGLGEGITKVININIKKWVPSTLSKNWVTMINYA
jgi:hypothetical protein